MESIPGPLLYQILKYTTLNDALVLECLSPKIQSKLQGNLSAFQYALEKKYRTDRKPFSECKQLLKSLKGKTVDLCYIPYYTNGGHFDGDWSVMNITSKNGQYCSSNNVGHNIIVKTINVANREDRNLIKEKWQVNDNEPIQHNQEM